MLSLGELSGTLEFGEVPLFQTSRSFKVTGYCAQPKCYNLVTYTVETV